MVDTSIPEAALARADPGTEVHLPKHLELEFQNSARVTPLVSITAEVMHSLAPEIFYELDGLPLPP